MNTIKQILICDDVADDALLLQTILLADDCYVEIVDSGAAVLSFLETSTNLPDLIILDVMMPKISGIDVVKHIRQSDRYQSIPILLVSALDRYDIENNIDIKVDGFIKKPINIDLVITKVQKILT